MKFFLAVLCAFMAISNVALSADLSGSIVVQKKDGQTTLNSFENGVAYLSGPIHDVPDEPAVSIQKGKLFLPRVLPVIKGQEVRFYNHDPIQHNVFSNQKDKSFDLGSIAKGDYRSETFEKSQQYKVFCNIHQEMVQDILVLDNGFFGATDETGAFQISDIPDGDYTLNIWHIYGGTYSADISVRGQDIQVDPITITNTRAVRETLNHKNKFGRRYRSRLY